MKATIFLRSPSIPTEIPWTYPEGLMAWVYRCLADYAYLGIEHHTTHRQIRPFALSHLQFPDPVHANVTGLHPSSMFATLTIGTVDTPLFEHFRRHAPDQPLILGSTVYRVEVIVADSPFPTSSPWVAHLTTPLVVADRVHGQRVFLRPDQSAFQTLVKRNLTKKARIFFGDSNDVDTFAITLPTTWHRKLWRLYHHPIIGWESAEPVVIQGPQSIIEAAVTLGLGVYNAHGFGFLATYPSGGAVHDVETSRDTLSLISG